MGSNPSMLPQMVLFLFIIYIYSIIYICVCVCVCVVCFSCIHVLTIVNSTVMNIRVRLSFQIVVLSECMPWNGIAESYSNSVLRFFRKLYTAFHSGWQVCIYINSVVSSFYSTSSLAYIICWLFDHGHSDQFEAIPHCGFDLHFSNN